MTEERDQGIARVEVALVMLQVIVRQKQLRDGQIESAEQLFVRGHEPGLADGGTGLQLGQIVGPLLMAERAHARADCA